MKQLINPDTSLNLTPSGILNPGHSPLTARAPWEQGSLSCTLDLWEVWMMHPDDADVIYLGISSFRTHGLCPAVPSWL